MPCGPARSSSLARVDPVVHELTRWERARQADKLIFIASESVCPEPVREALASEFGHVYAEGYPPRAMCQCEQNLLLDVAGQSARQRRLADRRYYKGCEFVNFVEALAQRRCAELFASQSVTERTGLHADGLFVNVQPLSGAAANNAVYMAFLEPGDTVMGMELTHGGHLTHGSPYNRSGRNYRIVSYGVDPRTGRLDYDQIRDLARRERPKMVIAGTSAYPWAIDWQAFREVADAAGGAVLLADIAHTAGLIAAETMSSPVGVADVVSFTTHKTLCGPRGAVLMTTDPDRARAIDRAVFPGEQGGPHIHVIAAKAVCFQLARTEAFRALAGQTIANARALAAAFQELGVTLAYGGTDSHLLLVDLKTYPKRDGVQLTAESASRLLDLCDITVNKNTILGDTSAVYPTGLRFGTTWVSQRGLRAHDMSAAAGIVHDLLRQTQPFEYVGLTTQLGRAKIDLGVMVETRQRAHALLTRNAERLSEAEPPFGVYTAAPGPTENRRCHGCACRSPLEVPDQIAEQARSEGRALVWIQGARASQFVDQVASADVAGLAEGASVSSYLLDGNGRMIDSVVVHRLSSEQSASRYVLSVAADRAGWVRDWLTGLSDGYILFGHEDLYAKIDGPVVVASVGDAPSADAAAPGSLEEAQPDDRVAMDKSFFIGQRALASPGTSPSSHPPFRFEPEPQSPRRTCLYERHAEMAAKSRLVPFAGWVMPVCYTSIGEEHQAVREHAGLFDVSHMGVLEVRGARAGEFLDILTTNHVPRLAVGHSHYTYLLDADGSVLDDMIVYRTTEDRYMIVANAANTGKVLAYLSAAARGERILDPGVPVRAWRGSAEVCDLKSADAGADARVDLALQGPAARPLLEELTGRSLARLRSFRHAPVQVDGIDVLLSHTGYTGERWGFELFVHPELAVALWDLLLERGKGLGVLPAGLGARDSLRTEAGLPLYGHELAGPMNVSPIEAGYGVFVKLHKPFFVGRRAMREQLGSDRVLVRFRLLRSGTRGLKTGDPIVTTNGQVVGWVTSATFVQGMQVGMALVARRLAEPGTRLGAFPLGRGKQAELPRAFELGARVPLHEPAEVLRRFGLPLPPIPASAH